MYDNSGLIRGTRTPHYVRCMSYRCNHIIENLTLIFFSF